MVFMTYGRRNSKKVLMIIIREKALLGGWHLQKRPFPGGDNWLETFWRG